jgi:hypothetical protein
MENGFPAPTPGQITNNYGVDPNYRLGYVQMWNLNVQRELKPTLVMYVGYTGSKGTDLDMLRAPDRGPYGLLIPNVQPFLWETSQGASILHAGSVTLNKRMAKGVSMGGTYTFAKSIDNASSINGAGSTVAQNDQDLAAERSLSNFDVRHKLTGNLAVELPFGTGKWWLDSGGFWAQIFGDWTWNASYTIQSGTPFTAQVAGGSAQVATGASGSLRADVTGQPIALSNPTLHEWFNTAAFVAPPSVPCTILGTPQTCYQFGDAGRNTIIGPGQITFNMYLSKNFPMRDMMGMEVRLQANNVFNTPQFTRIDTTVGSPTFGEVVGVGAMRTMQVQMRFRF